MQLYVGGLSNDTKEENIVELFSSVCPVQLVTIIRDIESGKSRGFAIVKILSEEDGGKAIGHLNGFALRGTNLLVRKMPETLPGEMEFRERLAEHASEVLTKVGIRKAQIILDYGCGSGTFTIPSARIVGKQGMVYAFEARSDLLERLKDRAGKEELTNIETTLSDRSKPNVNLKDESVDIILVYDVMHEIGNRLALLEELSRVLRRDGFLSVFPMHMGTDSMLDVMRECGLFCLRDRYSPPGFKAASEILNFDKCQPTR
jgi:tRNA A58 N-methylase Trm61